jgi:integrase
MPTETNRRGVLRWRGVVKIEGKIVASKWFGQGKKEERKAILWEEEEKQKFLELRKQQTPMALLKPLDWANGYLNDVQRRCSEKTYKEKKSALLRLLKFAGERELSQFNPSFALAFLQGEYDSRSGYAANKDRKNLATAWGWGSKFLEGFPGLPNPFLAIDRYKEERQPRYIPPVEDFDKVFDLAEGQDKVMLTAFLYLAARRGEIFRLKWTDIDFHNGAVRLTTRKTEDGSMRPDWIPMTAELKRSFLLWWQERPYKSSEYVFTMLDDGFSAKHGPGSPFKQRRHFMGKLCKRAGIEPFGFHAIRHLSAVILYKEGKPLSLIQKILRHQNPSTTEIYLASLGFQNEEMREALELLGQRGPAKIIPLPVKEKAQ